MNIDVASPVKGGQHLKKELRTPKSKLFGEEVGDKCKEVGDKSAGTNEKKRETNKRKWETNGRKTGRHTKRLSSWQAKPPLSHAARAKVETHRPSLKEQRDVDWPATHLRDAWHVTCSRLT